MKLDPNKLDQAAHAEGRALLSSQTHGVLSTMSVEIEGGYPFGSLTPYVLSRHGLPIVMMATIAQHRRNVQARPQVSLLAYDHNMADVQAAPRITLVGDIKQIESENAELFERYFRVFPEARSYASAHNFEFYQIHPQAIRYIGGFGRIHWLHPNEVCRANPFDDQAENAIIEHMNEDHQHNLRQYLKSYAGVPVAEDENLLMTAIDAEGFGIRHGHSHYRIQFEEAIGSSNEARQAMISLARNASD